MKKKLILIFSAFVLIFITSSYKTRSSTGMAGKTGAPGENTCGECHGGGSSAASGITISATPEFTLNQFTGGTTYTISVIVGATGFSRFGFGCEILDSVNVNAGVMQTLAGTGVKLMNAGTRKNATHSTPKSGIDEATFKFRWIAPNIDKATIYVCGNAVNFNGSTTGDLPFPSSLELTRMPDPVDTTVIDSNLTVISKHGLEPGSFNVYPNPAAFLTTVSYHIEKEMNVCLELYDLSGKLIKVLAEERQFPGAQSRFLNLQGIPAGVYFVRLSGDHSRLSQKLLTIL